MVYDALINLKPSINITIIIIIIIIFIIFTLQNGSADTIATTGTCIKPQNYEYN